jgi:hypothetical protein
MRYVLALLVLISHPSFACVDTKKALTVLYGSEFHIVATFELEKKPAAMFVNPYGEWMVFTYEKEKLCLVSQGKAFDFVPERYL